MAKQAVRDQQGITLRGSAEIVAEFFCKGLRGQAGGVGGGGGGGRKKRGKEGSPLAPVLRREMAAGGGVGGRGVCRLVSRLTSLPTLRCSLWDQQHPVPAGHLPPRDLHPRPEVRAHPAGHHRPRAEELPQQRGGADERCPGGLEAQGRCLRLAPPLTARAASFRVALQVPGAAPGGGHLQHRKQRGSGAVAVRHRVRQNCQGREVSNGAPLGLAVVQAPGDGRVRQHRSASSEQLPQLCLTKSTEGVLSNLKSYVTDVA